MIEELAIECPDFAFIEYHSLDDYSNVYSDARVEYYNILAFPNTHIDGIWQPDWNNYEAYVEHYTDRKALSTPYSLAIELEGNGIDFSGSISVGWLNPDNENKVLHLVFTESHIEESWYGGDEINYVARLMIPDQYGTPLEEEKNTDDVFSFSFTMEPEWVLDYCELVAFVQDTVSMEVWQTESLLMSEVELSWNDVALESIEYPDDEHCGELLSPVIQVKNLCFDNLNTVTVTYSINGDDYNFSWLGNVMPDSTFFINLPEVSFNSMDENNLSVTLSNPNGELDQNPDNDSQAKAFDKSMTIEAEQLLLELLTDDFGSETTWTLSNGAGEVIDEGGPYENNTLYAINWDVAEDDCFTFSIMDSGNNGICCESGNGYFIIKDEAGTLFYQGGEFTEVEDVLFQLDVATFVNKHFQTSKVKIFPNPGFSFLNIQANSQIRQVEIFDPIGRVVHQKLYSREMIPLDISNYEPGLYLVSVKTDTGNSLQKLMVR